MTEPSSPLYLINMIEQIREKRKKYLIENEILIDLENMFEVILQHHAVKPKAHIHGKKCTNCEHRMNCKSIRCPMCHAEMRKRKRQGCQENNKQEKQNQEKQIQENNKSENEIENECDGHCARDLSNERAIILPCNHKICVRCLKYRVEKGFIACFCNERIPEELMNEFKLKK